jgi:hypothetical protein
MHGRGAPFLPVQDVGQGVRPRSSDRRPRRPLVAARTTTPARTTIDEDGEHVVRWEPKHTESEPVGLIVELNAAWKSPAISTLDPVGVVQPPDDEIGG